MSARISKAPNARTTAPIGADAKHSFPILHLFRGHATGEIFGFAPISTAGETPGTPQAEPAKLAQVEVLPQLQEEKKREEIHECSTPSRKRSSRYERVMYLVVEGQPCPVTVGSLERAEICVGEECEDVEDELVIQAFEAAGLRWTD